MKRKAASGIVLILLLVGTLYTALNVRLMTGWSNGGFSVDPANPNYGTHDWIAQHALDWLPTEEKQYILDNLAAYLYGTELPDKSQAPDGIGDTVKHKIYYWSNGSLQNDDSAVRASEEYYNALNFLESEDFANVSKTLGIMSHYIVEVAVFGHVMGSEVHHSDYETYVDQRTSSYDAEFNVYLSFDGELRIVSAYDASIELAYDTTFDVDGDLTCVWMDQNYNWDNPVFKNRAGESLNLAVNYLADVLHTFYVEALPPLVQNIDTSLNYTMIQDAINAPETLDGHTIKVYSGIYYEHVVVNKSVSLIGEDRSTTAIDGSRNGTAVHVKANNTMIREFTIRKSGMPATEYTPSTDTGILVFAGYGQTVTNTTITDNNVRDNYAGVFIQHSNGSTVVGNKIEKNYFGIGIDEASYNNIDRNTVSNNNGGIWLGSGGNSVSNNTISSNLAYGVRLDGSYSNTVNGNHIENNEYGVELVSASSNNITGNVITSNEKGISLASSSGNNIYHNNFICNTVQVQNTASNNTWDNGYPSGGNYWSDYAAVDFYSGLYQNETGSDGIADTPYVIDDYNQDNYPLMLPTEVSLYVSPSLIEFWTPAYGTTFTVEVKIANIGELYGFEFKLYWNTSLLDLVGVDITPSVWGTNYFVGMNETREDLGRYWLAVAALDPAPAFCGSAVLATFTFKTTYDPIYPENVASALDLEDSKLSDPDAQLIPHDAYDGQYWCHSTKPKLTVTPPEFRVKKLGIPFTVNIIVSDVVNLYSFKFKLSYNTTILDAIDIEVGPFAETPYHIDRRIVDDAAGVVWLEVTSTNPAPPANGSGVLATITFEYFGCVWPDPPLQCSLHLYDTLLKTNLDVQVQHDTVDGLFIYEPIPGDLNSDGGVNVLDLRIVSRAYGSKPGDPNWDIRADLNRDGEIDIRDLVIAGRNYGRED